MQCIEVAGAIVIIANYERRVRLFDFRVQLHQSLIRHVRFGRLDEVIAHRFECRHYLFDVFLLAVGLCRC